ncbi:helix-turn-helix domain-containing protein [Photorhabdus bodei]|uniref:Helix-turn-helix domain-containing protein n=1 Tax=Photorhabdus bodei TaxID=2029681 RepID=A0A329WY86_9GAMM|nr:helix-turn-helix domain-containing protein [Photorhabdus bodei]NDL00709.1 helix-turn-helix domain-containing protein [Photorhabdus bodei]NDL04875.1 helix-turn-helix domain-containing protein [Photorhabdus bodei]NDL09208.1 helix-turn-helix domain-containing protein [Photorhabdus bodei]RAX09591.1 hypothetical protein CKY02_16870 [Photorhabdus bodei]
MSTKLDEMLSFAKELEEAGISNGDLTKKLEARIQVRNLSKHIAKARPMSGDEIKKLRDRYNISQASLALALNMTKESVSKWERGEIKPNGAALRMLNLIDKQGLKIITA